MAPTVAELVQSHFASLGVSLVVAVASSAIGLALLLLGGWLQWKWAAYTAMALWALAAMWFIGRVLWGGGRLLAGRSASRWPRR